MSINDETAAITTDPAIDKKLDFEAFSLSEEVSKALFEIGYVKPTTVQQATYQAIVDRRDLIVQARTGTGKTAAFAIPIIDKVVRNEPYVQVLVLAPTRELALQNAKELERIAKYKETRVTAIYGGAPMGKQLDELRRGVQIVSGTPGRILDHLKRGTLDLSRLRVLVLDEMDEMLSMGFAKELNAILELVPTKRQTLCFSATIDDAVQRLADKYMRSPEFLSLSSDAVGPEEVTHFVYRVSGVDRVRDLIQVIEIEDPESAIIFCNQKAETERVASELQQAGFDADWLNGDLSQQERERVMARTREGKLRFLVATDVAARGIDVSDLTHIINYTFPEAAVAYVHRTGRTGRAGRTGIAISLVSPQDLGELYYLRLEYKIFPVERSLPTRGELKTRKEADRIELLSQAFSEQPSVVESSLARRLLTYPGAERILAGLMRGFFGAKGVDVDEEAAAARRSRAAPIIPVREDDSDTARGLRRVRRTRSEPLPRREPLPIRNKAVGETDGAAPASFDNSSGHEQDKPGDRTDRGRVSDEKVDRERATRDIPVPRRERSNRPIEVTEQVEEADYDNDEPAEDLTGTLYLDIGKREGLRIGEIAKLLREQCGLARREVGRIRLRDRYTLVAVPQTRLDEIVSKLEGVELHDKKLAPERARTQ
jgi:ATP-dependent RNA helicase DeaD